MEKNTIWAIVLTTLVIIVFSTFQMMTATPVSTGVEENAESVVLDEIPEIATVTEDEEITVIPDITVIPEQEVVIDTDVIHAVFTNRGGDLIQYELKDHKDGDKLVQMVDNVSEKNRAFALSFGDDLDTMVDQNFNVRKIDANTVAFDRSFSVKNTDGSISRFNLTKKYSFLPDEYCFKLEVLIDGDKDMKGLNIDDAAYSIRTSPQIGPYYDPKKDRYENRTFMTIAKDKTKKTNIGDDVIKIYDKDFNWAAITGKYFSIIGAAEDTSIVKNAYFSKKIEVNDYANAQVFLVRNPIEGKTVHDTYYFYAGPRVNKSLKMYNNAANNGWNIANMKFDYCQQSSGILAWLEIALKFIMEQFNKIVHNWGISIIIMTILLRLVLYPLSKKSSLSSVKMQAFQPRIQELQEKYKDNKEKLNVEMSKLYKEVGYNPASGCVPLLIQFPLIIAMFNLFNNYFDFRGAMFIPGWIPDLSTGDSVATLGFNIPILGTNQLRILPIIYLASQMVYGKITQAANPQTGSSATTMKIMTYAMPIFFFFIFYSAPSGLLIYWTLSNFLTMIQQIFINKMVKKEKAALEAVTPKKEVFTKKTKK